jgi:hypothetical protein
MYLISHLSQKVKLPQSLASSFPPFSITITDMDIQEATSSYVDLLQKTANSIDSLIQELEDQTLHDPAFRKTSIDMAMDSVPAVRFLRESKKQIEISLTIYGD